MFYINRGKKKGTLLMGAITKICSSIYHRGRKTLNEVAKTVFLPRDTYRGYKQGARLSKIKKTNSLFEGAKIRSVGALRKGIAPHMGGLFGLITYPIFIPTLSTSSYLLGRKLGNALIKKLRKY